MKYVLCILASLVVGAACSKGESRDSRPAEFMTTEDVVAQANETGRPFAVNRVLSARVVSNAQHSFFAGTSLVHVKIDGDIRSDWSRVALVSESFAVRTGMDVVCRDVETMIVQDDGEILSGGIFTYKILICEPVP